MYNSSGDDDDCKYHLSFTTTPVAVNTNVYFTVTVVQKANNMPETGGMFQVEGTNEDMTQPAMAMNATTVENPPGTFKYGPVQFTSSGKWLVKFHIHEECTDNDEASQHGHGTFYINVP